jgi:hypothetical protein
MRPRRRAVQIAVVQPADRNRVFVADLTAERAGLGETNVVGFGRRAAINDAGLRGDELAVLFVAQPNGLGRNAATARASPRQDDKSRRWVLNRRNEGLSVGIRPVLCRCRRLDVGASVGTSIVASLSRKPASTRSASATISVFLAARFSWTQSAASSADTSWLRSASNRSRSSPDASGPRMVRAGRTAFSLRRNDAGAGGP